MNINVYGALLNVGSRFFDARLGQSTTLTGRCIDKHMAAQVNQLIAGEYDYKGDAVIYCVDGSTELHINDEIQPISDLYDNTNITPINGIKYLHNKDIFTLSYNCETGEREYKKVKAVSKQTAIKKMYKVWITDDKHVTVTEDHRFIVKRNGKIVESTVKDLKDDDVFINVNGYTKNCLEFLNEN